MGMFRLHLNGIHPPDNTGKMPYFPHSTANSLAPVKPPRTRALVLPPANGPATGFFSGICHPGEKRYPLIHPD